MYILAFETTGAQASVACIDEKGNLFAQSSEGVLNHLQNLMPMTESLLKENGIAMSDISCVAASTGPGSFTGIRIGVSSARAVAQAMNIPCISVPTLPSFSYNIENYKGLVCPILDARRNQVYGGAFYVSNDSVKSNLNGGSGEPNLNKNIGDIHEAVPGGAYDVGEYLQFLRAGIAEQGVSDILFFGDGIKVYQDKVEKWQSSSLNDDIRLQFAPKDKRGQKASSVAKLALKLYNEGKQVNYENLMPVYMRKAEAERKFEEGLLFLKESPHG